VAEDDVALVAEEVDKAEDETGTPALSMVSTRVTRTEASRELNGSPWVPTVELQSYHCEAPKAEVDAVDAVDATGVEDVPRRPTEMSAVPISSNMMQLRTTKLLTLARI
jgi:hypothetical protein